MYNTPTKAKKNNQLWQHSGKVESFALKSGGRCMHQRTCFSTVTHFVQRVRDVGMAVVAKQIVLHDAHAFHQTVPDSVPFVPCCATTLHLSS
eukprot:m.68300 g.68300  ORF g.68300 m.68300 type:complete len:92 (+) comp15983_c0_seq5:156-431(+)